MSSSFKKPMDFSVPPRTEDGDDPMTVADLFRIGIALEKQVGVIYGQLARRFARFQELQDF